MNQKSFLAFSFALCELVSMATCGSSRFKITEGSATSTGSSTLNAESLKGSPKESIAYQLELVKEGHIAELKECFTERQRENITSEIVEKGKTQASLYTLADLVASVEMGEADGQRTAKVIMKNGRTLTTLVQTDGKWLADTVWFK